MKSRPHWSYSALTQYLRCPLQFYFQRVLKLAQPFTPSGLVLGSAVHEAIAVYHRGIQSEKPLPVEVIQQAFVTAWDTRKFHERILIDGDKTEREVLDQGIALLEAYLKEPPPEKIVAVELEMLAPLHTTQGDILEKPMTVVIDLITEHDHGLKITDLKTSGRSYSEMEAALSLQGTCYVNAVRENVGQMATFEYAVIIKTRKPRVQRLQSARTDEDLARLGNLVAAVDRAIKASVFYPIESPLNCSGCPFRKPCRVWRGVAAPVQTEPACNAIGSRVFSPMEDDIWEAA